MGAPWTETDLRRLARMIERGMTFERIGKKLGRTASACSARASADGMSGRKTQTDKAAPRPRWDRWMPEEDKAIRSRGARTHKEVAVRLGRTESAVAQRAMKIGAQRRPRRASVPPRPWTEDDDAGLDALLWSGASRGEIAAQLDRSVEAVRQRVMGRAGRERA